MTIKLVCIIPINYLIQYFDDILCHFQLSPRKDKPFAVQANQKTYTVGGLEAYTTYKFAVFAKNTLGSSVKSLTVTATTLETCKFNTNNYWYR